MEVTLGDAAFPSPYLNDDDKIIGLPVTHFACFLKNK